MKVVGENEMCELRERAEEVGYRTNEPVFFEVQVSKARQFLQRGRNPAGEAVTSELELAQRGEL